MLKNTEHQQQQPSSEQSQYQKHLMDAYQWYDRMKIKSGKTPLELSWLLLIEESHKNTILRQFHDYLTTKPTFIPKKRVVKSTPKKSK